MSINERIKNALQSINCFSYTADEFIAKLKDEKLEIVDADELHDLQINAVEINTEWLKEKLQTFEKKTKQIEKLLPKHICRFNDGKCECDCYKQAIDDVLNLLK